MSSITEDFRPLDEQAFGARVEPHRRELHLHCYRLRDGVVTEIVTFDAAVFAHFDLPATLR